MENQIQKKNEKKITNSLLGRYPKFLQFEGLGFWQSGDTRVWASGVAGL